MEFDRQRVWANARQATTEDLLDRVTLYRAGMEPEALEIIEAELQARGVGADQIEVHARQRGRGIIRRPDGTPRPCSFCPRPAVAGGWGWQRLRRGEDSSKWLSSLSAGPLWWLGFLLPIFPRHFYYCEKHSGRADSNR